MLGISYGEVALIMVAAVAMFGPKDIPIIARAAGRLSGKAVGYIQSARASVDGVIERGQVKQVHKELQETMAQLEAIRHEINSGISLVNPGPLTRRIMNVDSPGARPVSSPAEAEAGEVEEIIKSDFQSKHIVGTQNGLGLGTQIASQMQNLQHSTSASQCTSGILDAMPPSAMRVDVQRIQVKSIAQAPTPGSSPTRTVQDVTVLPISALSAGILPFRTEALPGGSDLVYEAIVERKVAFDTLEFLKQAESLSK